MRLIIDFDHTLFDTQRLRYALLDEVGQRGKGEKTPQPALAQLEHYLYADALPFLQRHRQHHITLLTFGSPRWQRYKIERSGIDRLVDDILVTEDSKVAALMAQGIGIEHDDSERIFFINDRGSEIDAMTAAFPTMRAVWIRRPGSKYVDEPCATAFAQQPDLLWDIHSLI